MKNLKRLKKEYEEIEIPSELEGLVKNAIKQVGSPQKNPVRIKRWGVSAAAAAALFICSINVSPALAQSMLDVPGLGAIVKVFTVEKMYVEEETYNAELTIPAIDGLGSGELESDLNEKYIAENKALLEKFTKEMAEMKKAGDGYLSVDSGYEVITDNNQLLSIARFEVNTAASASTTMRYDTIDKEYEVLITLPSLFKDDQYIDVISGYIAGEMKRQMAEDDGISYFTSDEITEGFKVINSDQNFYITPENKLVISFDEYEAAPGFMGVVTFEIPSNLLKDLLVSDRYIH